MRQRQQHARMVVCILGGVEDRSIDVERTRPAAIFGAAIAGDEVETVGDEPLRRTVPAALLGHREGVDLARHGAHALRLHQRLAVHSQRLVEAAMHLVDAGSRPKRQGFPEQPVTNPPPPGAGHKDRVGRRRHLGFQPPALFQLLNDLLDVLAAVDRRDEGRVRRRDDGHVLQADGREQAAIGAEVRILAVDGDDVADDDIAVFVGRAGVEQRLPGAEVVPCKSRRHHRNALELFDDGVVDGVGRDRVVEVERHIEAGIVDCGSPVCRFRGFPDGRIQRLERVAHAPTP